MSSTVHAAELEPRKIYILDQKTFGSMYRPKLNALNINISRIYISILLLTTAEAIYVNLCTNEK